MTSIDPTDVMRDALAIAARLEDLGRSAETLDPDARRRLRDVLTKLDAALPKSVASQPVQQIENRVAPIAPITDEEAAKRLLLSDRVPRYQAGAHHPLVEMSSGAVPAFGGKGR